MPSSSTSTLSDTDYVMQDNSPSRSAPIPGLGATGDTHLHTILHCGLGWYCVGVRRGACTGNAVSERIPQCARGRRRAGTAIRGRGLSRDSRCLLLIFLILGYIYAFALWSSHSSSPLYTNKRSGRAIMQQPRKTCSVVLKGM